MEARHAAALERLEVEVSVLRAALSERDQQPAGQPARQPAHQPAGQPAGQLAGEQPAGHRQKLGAQSEGQVEKEGQTEADRAAAEVGHEDEAAEAHATAAAAAASA